MSLADGEIISQKNMGKKVKVSAIFGESIFVISVIISIICIAREISPMEPTNVLV